MGMIEREHELSAFKRAREFEFRKQFVNWVAVASAGGIAMLLAHVSSDADAITITKLKAYAVSFLAWDVAVILSGAALLGMIQEARSSARMWHRAAARDEKHAKVDASDNHEKRERLSQQADLDAKEEARHYLAANFWRETTNFVQTVAAFCFVVGAIWPLYVLLV